jgi:hypothetical protein
VIDTPFRSILPVRERLAIAAGAIEPILNRVVLVGPPVVTLLMTDSTLHTPNVTFAADSTLQLLSTSMIDRLGVELEKRGLSRVGRADGADRWRVSEEVVFDLIQVHTDDDDPEPPWLEYATLLTLPLTIGPQLVVRIAGAPAMLALEFASFRQSRVRTIESEELERALLLIAGRSEIERECAVAPPELRSIIVSSLKRMAGDDTLELLIQRTLPDSVLLPALATHVQERIRRMAC